MKTHTTRVGGFACACLLDALLHPRRVGSSHNARWRLLQVCACRMRRRTETQQLMYLGSPCKIAWCLSACACACLREKEYVLACAHVRISFLLLRAHLFPRSSRASGLHLSHRLASNMPVSATSRARMWITARSKPCNDADRVTCWKHTMCMLRKCVCTYGSSHVRVSARTDCCKLVDPRHLYHSIYVAVHRFEISTFLYNTNLQLIASWARKFSLMGHRYL